MGAMRFFLTFVAKHHLLASVLDVGYSACRHPATPRPVRAWLRHSGLEAAMTVGLTFPAIGWAGALFIATMEFLLMGICCLLERTSTHQSALRTHFSCESAVWMFYGVAGIVVDIRPG